MSNTRSNESLPLGPSNTDGMSNRNVLNGIRAKLRGQGSENVMPNPSSTSTSSTSSSRSNSERAEHRRTHVNSAGSAPISISPSNNSIPNGNNFT